MKENEKEQINDLVVKMQGLANEFDSCISELENLLQANEEKTAINDVNDVFYQHCKIKDTCVEKNCTECIYKNEGKNYYMGGQ